MKNRRLEKTLPGSITIEASVVVPFILVVLTSLLLASILIHDVYVIRTSNSLKADGWVIAGEACTTEEFAMTVIIKPKILYTQFETKYFMSNRYTSEVAGTGSLSVFDVVFDAGDKRDYAVKSPKSFVRGIDFMDDASDMWDTSRAIKDSYMSEVKAIEEILKGD